MLGRRLMISALLLCSAGVSAAAPDGILIPAGTFLPFFKNTPPSSVSAFYLDRTQVTNTQFLEFLKANPSWKKNAVKRIFADAAYLGSWSGDRMPPNAESSPVTGVSFFSARAYCNWRGKRLPTLAEWEYAAGADPVRPMSDAENERVIAWYSRPSSAPGPVGQRIDVHGVYDMHGLVWEWVSDFNSVLLSEESREQGSDTQMFCGGGAMNANNFRNYAAFMRYAFRSSLRSNYTGANLGFRCAADK